MKNIEDKNKEQLQVIQNQGDKQDETIKKYDYDTEKGGQSTLKQKVTFDRLLQRLL